MKRMAKGIAVGILTGGFLIVGLGLSAEAGGSRYGRLHHGPGYFTGRLLLGTATGLILSTDYYYKPYDYGPRYYKPYYYRPYSYGRRYYKPSYKGGHYGYKGGYYRGGRGRHFRGHGGHSGGRHFRGRGGHRGHR